MQSSKLTVQKTVFIKHYVWYLAIVYFKGVPVNFWSFHDRTGMPDEQAKTAFTREHFKEVGELVAQKMQHDLLPQLD